MNKPLGVALSALVLLGCGGEYGDDVGDVEETVAPVVNGSTDLSTYANEQARTVILNNVTNNLFETCSAVVLRPTVALTAQHCVTSNGKFGGPPGNPASIVVNGFAARKIVFPIADTDAALVFFSSPIVPAGNDFTAIDPYPASNYLAQTHTVLGYGLDENGRAGTLRVGTVKVKGVNTSYTLTSGGTAIGIKANNTTTGTAAAKGDSGGGLWRGGFSYPRPITGVTSAGFGTAFADSYFAQADKFRFLFRNTIVSEIDPSLNIGFDSSAERTQNFVALQPTTGTACNWSVSGSALRQNANAPQCYLIQKGVFENVIAQTYVQSSDDDTVGIVLRYVDSNNFYRCDAATASHTLQIVRRQNGAETIIKSTAWDGTFDATMQFSAIEKTLDCSIANTRITTTSVVFPIGQVGLYDHFNRGAAFLRWTAAQVAPQDITW